MSEPSKCVLSLAGFDPSGGAGILADCKTFEACRVRGLGVCTALTYQSDNEFFGLRWCTQEEILSQLDPILHRFSPKVAKIGIIENLTVLEVVIERLEHAGVECIVWDPVLKASAGFVFHDALEVDELQNLLPRISLLTPNQEEFKMLKENLGANFEGLPKALLLKGSEGGINEVRDTLYIAGKLVQSWAHKKLVGSDKHGSGCVLSSAIAAYVASGASLEVACSHASDYISSYLQSSDDLLGWHPGVQEEAL
ncbi:MAG: hydroxymethylpyrimidine/phosphomethylpyrimidine kinase [Bdellovibrionales bacterium]|nr:hydroxymethylpyrimidine/phosphomethylpyrimidine kinase [Bdellovibrionales bacterium]